MTRLIQRIKSLSKKSIIIIATVVAVIIISLVALKIMADKEATRYITEIKSYQEQVEKKSDAAGKEATAADTVDINALPDKTPEEKRKLDAAIQKSLSSYYGKVVPVIKSAKESAPSIREIPLGNILSGSYKATHATSKEITHQYADVYSDYAATQEFYKNYVVIRDRGERVRKLYSGMLAFEKITLTLAQASARMDSKEVRATQAKLIRSNIDFVPVFKQILKDTPFPTRFDKDREKVNKAADKFIESTNAKADAFEKGDFDTYTKLVRKKIDYNNPDENDDFLGGYSKIYNAANKLGDNAYDKYKKLDDRIKSLK